MNRHSELLKEIVETKKASRYRFFELDLRDPLHRECVMSRFGGKDLLAFVGDVGQSSGNSRRKS